MPEPNSPPPLADATHTPARPTVSPSELLTSGETDEASSGSFAVVKVGDTLAGYKLIQLLGEGGMGLVFAAEDIRLKRKVALKMMKPEIAAKASHRERFLREAQAAVVVEHDHIVAIHQIGEEKGIPFIVMPFLQGEPLDVRLKRGRLSAPEFMSIGRQVAEGLAAAHAKGLIHRDIKPANIWLEAGSSPRAKILDFGLARLTNDEVHLTQSGAIMGTPAYMSPEQARGIKVDHRADLFSLGVMLYEMSTGQRPFTGHDTMSVLFSLASDTPVPPIELNPDLPPIFSRLVERLLAKDVEKRIQTGRDVADVLQRLQPEKTVVVIATSQPIVEENPFADLDSSSATNVGVTYSLDEESSERSATRTSNSVRGAQPRSKKTMYFAFAGIALLALSIGAFFAFRGKNEPKPDAVVKSNDPPKKAKIDPPKKDPLPIVTPKDPPAYVPVTLEEKEAKKLQADCAAKLKMDEVARAETTLWHFFARFTKETWQSRSGVGEVLRQWTFAASSQKGNFVLDRSTRAKYKEMRIISKKTLKEYWEREPDAKATLEAWHAEAKNAEWSSPADVKARFGTASILKDGRVVFNIGGNKYRLVVWINYDFFTIYIRFTGSHTEYDEIDAQPI